MKIKVSQATSLKLDWLVGTIEKVEGLTYSERTMTWYSPSTMWAQGGLIIERELNNLFKHNQLDPSLPEVWCGVVHKGSSLINIDGPTPLIAAMRCFVASKLGEEVEVPDELA